MVKEDFQIGMEFYTASGKWRCTDIGTRVIVAIKLDQTSTSYILRALCEIPPFKE